MQSLIAPSVTLLIISVFLKTAFSSSSWRAAYSRSLTRTTCSKYHAATLGSGFTSPCFSSSSFYRPWKSSRGGRTGSGSSRRIVCWYWASRSSLTGSSMPLLLGKCMVTQDCVTIMLLINNLWMIIYRLACCSIVKRAKPLVSFTSCNTPAC